MIVLAVVLFGIAIFGGMRAFTRAEVADFFPNACLGTWKNTARAQFGPETFGAQNPVFNDSNSAVFESGGLVPGGAEGLVPGGVKEDIFCGSFLPATYEGTGEIKNVGLTLVWHVGREVPPSPPASSGDGIPPPAPEPVQPSPEEFASSTTEALVVSPEPEVTPAPEPIAPPPEGADGGTESVSTPAPEPVPLPPAEEPPPPPTGGIEPPPDSSTSLFNRASMWAMNYFVSRAFAQTEDVVSTENTDTILENAETTPVTAPPELAPTPESPPPAPEPTPEVTPPSSEPASEPIAPPASEPVSPALEPEFTPIPTSGPVPADEASQQEFDEPVSESATIIAPPILLPLEPVPTEEEEDVVSGTISEEEDSSPVILAEPADENFLKVSYSTDGDTWIEISRVNIDNWRNFTITLPITDWEDLKKLQVRVESIPTLLGEIPTVYLDGMLLEVHYEILPAVIDIPFFSGGGTPVDGGSVASENKHEAPPKPLMKILDKSAKHSCKVTPFTQAAKKGTAVSYAIALTPSADAARFELQTGDLPPGVSALFNPQSGTGSATSTLGFVVADTAGSGSFDVVVVYKEADQSNDVLTNFCQLNLIIE